MVVLPPMSKKKEEDIIDRWKPWTDLEPEHQMKILKDVSARGFASELRARRIFKENGFSEVRAFFYLDKDQNKSRELDILAARPWASTEPFFYHIFVAEVKSGYMWIAGDSIEEDPVVIAHSIPTWYKDLYQDAPPRPPPALSRLIEILEEFPARAPTTTSTLTQNHLNSPSERKDDAWYAAASAVFKAAMTLEKPFVEGKGVVDPKPLDLFTVVPLIILEGNLMRASLVSEVGDDRELELESCDHLQLSFSFASSEYEMEKIQIQIVTMKGLPSFLEKVMAIELEASTIAGELFAEYQKQPPRKPRISL